MQIQILARSRKEKGDLFEEFTEMVLDGVGYEDFRRDVRKTGRQIDLYAKHKVTRHPIICECKAHSNPIGAEELNKFYGIYDREYRQNDKLVGLLLSLSGFGSTAMAAYEEMPPEVKERFLLLDSTAIASMLRKTKIISSDDKLDYIITSQIKYGLSERYLVYARTGIYWVQLVLTNDKVTHYLILGPKGEEVPRYICSEIVAMDARLSNFQLLDIHAMKKTIISLLNATSKTLNEISSDINECAETVLLALQNLMSQGLVVPRKDQTYHLAKELTTFIELARQFLGSENEMEFFLSSYCDEMVNLSLVNYCELRFGLELTPQVKEPLLGLIKISPSALHEVLFGSVKGYRKTGEHLKEMPNLPDAEHKRVKEIIIENFIGTLLRKLIADLERPSSKTILKKRGIKGWKTRILVNLAGLDKLILSVEAHDVVMILPATGKIETGELVSVSDYDLLINIGLVFANLGEHEEAVRNYNTAIKHLSNPIKLKAAWNNKGLSFASLKKYDEAIQCYDQALKIDNRLKEAWYNKGLVYAFKGEHENAIGCYFKALEIDSNYSAALRAKEDSIRLLESNQDS